MTAHELTRLLGLIILLSSISIYIIWGIKTGYFRLLRWKWIRAGENQVKAQIKISTIKAYDNKGRAVNRLGA
jgi:hypothetical protein